MSIPKVFQHKTMNDIKIWNSTIKRRRRRLTEDVSTKFKVDSHSSRKKNSSKSFLSSLSIFRRRKTIFLNHLVVTLIINIILLLFSMPSTAIAPYKYETAYACEGKTLAIECEPGYVINLIRANYGRFSITICNDHGNTDWSVNCMSVKSLRVLHSKCAYKQNCSVLASTNMFGDPCQGTHKYLEAHYVCLSAEQTSTTTNRPSPPWLLTSQPHLWSTTSRYTTSPTTIKPNTSSKSQHNTQKVIKATTTPLPTISLTSSTIKSVSQYSSTPSTLNSTNESKITNVPSEDEIITSTLSSSSVSSVTQIGDIFDKRNRVTQSTLSSTNGNLNTQINENSNYFCSLTSSRNLIWNTTRVGEVNVQSCPGGATGIAKWRCGFNTDIYSEYNNKPQWQPQTPDLTHCRSLWLNNLEVRANQRDSPLISIANELSQVTSSKTLYGGDMLVTIKIIHTMSEKMTNDIETFPDQRQREAIVYELLHGVVKTGSNLLDSSQHLSWLDLSFEDQMRVATSLLTGLEDCAFLLADTITRERNVVQKVKNILLSVRVLETRNIVGNEVFPDSNVEQWPVSDDRIDLPRTALIENSESGLVKIVFVAFDRLESILRPTNIVWSDLNSNNKQINNSSKINNVTSVTSPQQKDSLNKNRILNSKVISASLGKGRHIQLSQPIRLILKHLKIENVTNPSCVFWNYIDHAWSEDGCYVETTNKTHTVCICNHLTNFAILMEVTHENSLNNDKTFDNKILILIYISITICIILIIIAILALKLLNGIFVKSNRTTIYKNLYMCLLAIEILFLIGIKLKKTHILCGFTSAFLHCSFLCTIAWIFFEGFQLYLMVSKDDILIESDKSSKIIWYYLLTYGLSFTIVAIALWIDPSTYTKAEYCIWMEKNNLFYYTFIAPIILFILANIFYSIKAFYLMCKKYNSSLKNKEHTRLASVRFYLRCSLIFLIIFISVWIFGYLYLNNINNNLYGYIFIILNLIQGFFILLCNFIQNEKFRNEYIKYIRNITWLPKCLRCFKKTSTVTSGNNNLGTTQQINVSPHLTNNTQHNLHQTQTESNSNHVELSKNTNTLLKQHNMNQFNPGMMNSFGTLRVTSGVGLNGAVDQLQQSPSSSVGSTHLIYNGQDCNNIQHPQSKPDLSTLPNNRKLKLLKQQTLHDNNQIPNESECFYWRDKNKYRSEDLLQHLPNYPYSYKKNKGMIINETISSISHNHPQSSTSTSNLGQSQNRYLYKMEYPIGGAGNMINPPSGYNTVMDQSNYFSNTMGYLEEPVYEEIMSNRVSYSDIGQQNIHPHHHHHHHQNPQQIHQRHSLNQENDDTDDEEDITDEDDNLMNGSYKINNLINNSNEEKLRRHNLMHEQSLSEHQKQQQIGRNLSAMLDGNNTVICYLEPLPTK